MIFLGLFENNIISNNGWDGIILMGESDAIIRSTTVVDNSYNGIAISSEGRCNVEHCEIAKNIWVFQYIIVNIIRMVLV